MKLSEYIKQLQEIEKEYGGDIEVVVEYTNKYNMETELVEVDEPEVLIASSEANPIVKIA